jgi:hypothetical protein
LEKTLNTARRQLRASKTGMVSVRCGQVDPRTFPIALSHSLKQIGQLGNRRRIDLLAGLGSAGAWRSPYAQQLGNPVIAFVSVGSAVAFAGYAVPSAIAVRSARLPKISNVVLIRRR